MSAYHESYYHHASEDWNRRNEHEREHILKLMDLPSSEASCNFDELRPQVVEALLESEVERQEDFAVKYGPEEEDDE